MQKKVAELISRATSDGLVQIKDHIELGTAYVVDPDSKRDIECYNRVHKTVHVREWIDVFCPDGAVEQMPVELLRISEGD